MPAHRIVVDDAKSGGFAALGGVKKWVLPFAGSFSMSRAQRRRTDKQQAKAERSQARRAAALARRTRQRER